MINLLKAAFKITWFQIAYIATFSLLKYCINTFQLADKIHRPLVWTGIVLGLLFIISVGIMGVIQNKGLSWEEWRARETNSTTEKALGSFASWGLSIPVMFGYVLLVYMIMPTSLYTFIALYIGWVIRNIFDYFKDREI